MREFNKRDNYDEHMDKEVIDLCNVMNSLPGIKTSESCSGHGKTPLNIFFKVTDLEGLFFLMRCIDRRYWKYGNIWKVDISVGDTFNGSYLPIIYLLSSNKSKGEEAYKQSQSLIENLNYYLNHKNFLEYYNINLDKFEYKDD
jgi:hypothetical protein